MRVNNQPLSLACTGQKCGSHSVVVAKCARFIQWNTHTHKKWTVFPDWICDGKHAFVQKRTNYWLFFVVFVLVVVVVVVVVVNRLCSCIITRCAQAYLSTPFRFFLFDWFRVSCFPLGSLFFRIIYVQCVITSTVQIQMKIINLIQNI